MVLPLLDQGDIEYSLNLQVGEDKQELNFILDTGSSDCWVMSNDCEKCNQFTDLNFNPINLYHSDAEQGTSQYISYGSGSIRGTETQDVISFNNSDQELNSSNSFTLSFLALHETDIEGLNQSGLLGLGFTKIKAYNSNTFLDTIVESGLITDKMFMFNMANTNQNDVVSTDGGIAFGSSAIKTVLGEEYDQLTWINLTDESQWTTSFNSLTLGDPLKNGFRAKLNENIIFDTGTSLNQMDPEIVQQTNLQMESALSECGTTDLMGDEMQACKCTADQFHSLSGMTISLNGHDVELPLQSWLLQDQEDGVCVNFISPAQDGLNILGDSFFKYYHVVFDQDNNKVGIKRKDTDDILKKKKDQWQGQVYNKFYDISMVAVVLSKSIDRVFGNEQGSKQKTQISIMILILCTVVLVVQIVFKTMKRDKNQKVDLVNQESNQEFEGSNQYDEGLLSQDERYKMWE